MTKTYELQVLPQNIGAFIGQKGSNFKKMISEMKKKILDKRTEITPEEWASITILLKFEKGEKDSIFALYRCKKAHEPVLKEVLDTFVELHKTENEKYEKKKITGKKLVYRIGAKHRFIGRMIGVGGSNVGQLKKAIATLPMVESISQITIEEQLKRYNGDFRNLGERGALEHIMMFITLKGTPDFEVVEAVVKDFVKHHTSDAEEAVGGLGKITEGDEEDEEEEKEEEKEEEEDEFDGGW